MKEYVAKLGWAPTRNVLYTSQETRAQHSHKVDRCRHTQISRSVGTHYTQIATT